MKKTTRTVTHGPGGSRTITEHTVYSSSSSSVGRNDDFRDFGNSEDFDSSGYRFRLDYGGGGYGGGGNFGESGNFGARTNFSSGGDGGGSGGGDYGPSGYRVSVDMDGGGQRSNYKSEWGTRHGGSEPRSTTGPPTQLKNKTYDEIKAQCQRENRLFEDPDFPAVDKSVGKNTRTTSQLEWKRPSVSNFTTMQFEL